MHTATSDKFFGDANFVARSGLLRCLLAWDSLAARGLVQLWSGQNKTYYSCILSAAKPDDVLPNLPVATTYLQFADTAQGQMHVVPLRALEVGMEDEVDNWVDVN